MTIEEFLKTHFENKIKDHECLVLYDPDKKYKPIIRTITGYELVDAEESTILGRERAMELWKQRGDNPGKAKQFLIYLPIKPPVKDEEIRENPYLAFEIGGAVFPHGDEDNFQSLCRKAFPDKIEQIDELFSHDPSPDFTAINTAVESDKGWPILRSLLDSESTRETLVAFLSPNPEQEHHLETSINWVNEFKQFVRDAFLTVPLFFVIGNVLEDTWYWDKIAEYHTKRYSIDTCQNCFVQRFCHLCYEKLNDREDNLDTQIRNFCQFNRHFFKTIFKYMLKILHRNPMLWNEIQKMAEERKDDLLKEKSEH